MFVAHVCSTRWIIETVNSSEPFVSPMKTAFVVERDKLTCKAESRLWEKCKLIEAEKTGKFDWFTLV